MQRTRLPCQGVALQPVCAAQRVDGHDRALVGHAMSQLATIVLQHRVSVQLWPVQLCDATVALAA